MILYNFRNVPNCYITTQLIGKGHQRLSGIKENFFIDIYHREILKAIKFDVKVNTEKTVQESTLQSSSRLS